MSYLWLIPGVMFGWGIGWLLASGFGFLVGWLLGWMHRKLRD